MTLTQHVRAFSPQLEVRSSGDGRTVYGIAVPWNAPTRIDDRLIEQFARGAFNHQLRSPQRVKFAREHMLRGGTLIGAATLLRDDASGLYGEWRVSKTQVGDETLELIRDGAYSHLSIMFMERQNRKLPGGITERVTADLAEVATVLEGAYGEMATAAGVRASSGISGVLDDEERDLLVKAEKYLTGGRKALPDIDLQVRAINLGLPYTG